MLTPKQLERVKAIALHVQAWATGKSMGRLIAAKPDGKSIGVDLYAPGEQPKRILTVVAENSNDVFYWVTCHNSNIGSLLGEFIENYEALAKENLELKKQLENAAIANKG